jgi:hypothetical protein
MLKSYFSGQKNTNFFFQTPPPPPPQKNTASDSRVQILHKLHLNSKLGYTDGRNPLFGRLSTCHHSLRKWAPL